MLSDLAPFVFASLLLLVVGFWFSPYELKMEEHDDEEILYL